MNGGISNMRGKFINLEKKFCCSSKMKINIYKYLENNLVWTR